MHTWQGKLGSNGRRVFACEANGRAWSRRHGLLQQSREHLQSGVPGAGMKPAMLGTVGQAGIQP